MDGDFEYARNETGLTLVKYNGSDASVSVPDAVQGMTITIIGESAFMDNKTLVSIDLPDTVVVIEARAFKGCTSLSKMN